MSRKKTLFFRASPVFCGVALGRCALRVLVPLFTLRTFEDSFDVDGSYGAQSRGSFKEPPLHFWKVFLGALLACSLTGSLGGNVDWNTRLPLRSSGCPVVSCLELAFSPLLDIGPVQLCFSGAPRLMRGEPVYTGTYPCFVFDRCSCSKMGSCMEVQMHFENRTQADPQAKPNRKGIYYDSRQSFKPIFEFWRGKPKGSQFGGLVYNKCGKIDTICIYYSPINFDIPITLESNLLEPNFTKINAKGKENTAILQRSKQTQQSTNPRNFLRIWNDQEDSPSCMEGAKERRTRNQTDGLILLLWTNLFPHRSNRMAEVAPLVRFKFQVLLQQHSPQMHTENKAKVKLQQQGRVDLATGPTKQALFTIFFEKFDTFRRKTEIWELQRCGGTADTPHITLNCFQNTPGTVSKQVKATSMKLLHKIDVKKVISRKKPDFMTHNLICTQVKQSLGQPSVITANRAHIHATYAPINRRTGEKLDKCLRCTPQPMTTLVLQKKILPLPWT